MKLVRIEIGRRLDDPAALLVQQFPQLTRFRLAALRKLTLHGFETLGGDAFQRRHQIGDIALDQDA